MKDHLLTTFRVPVLPPARARRVYRALAAAYESTPQTRAIQRDLRAIRRDMGEATGRTATR